MEIARIDGLGDSRTYRYIILYSGGQEKVMKTDFCDSGILVCSRGASAWGRKDSETTTHIFSKWKDKKIQ